MPSPSLAALTGFDKRVVVGVGEFTVSNNPSLVLATYSLGSCLGVTIYDPVTRAGGLLHAMLPDSSLNPADAASQPAKFVDTGVPALFRACYNLKAEKHRVHICVVGGAQVMDAGRFFNIGQRNHASLTRLLAGHGLRVQAEQVGGMVSRTVMLNLRSGEVKLKVQGQNEETVLWKG